MRTVTRVLAAAVVAVCLAAPLRASGPLGIYGIVEKVVFEPGPNAPERVQVWGAFAYSDGDPRPGAGESQVKRGYLYFRLPAGGDEVYRRIGRPVPDPTDAELDRVKTEWKDLASVAGTGQAVGFGKWMYIGVFPTVPDAPPSNWIGLPRGGESMDLRVRPASEPPASPAMYETNAGIVKLAPNGSRAAIVTALRKALGLDDSPVSR